MGKTVAASRAEVPNWFHTGVIATPGYDPPGFEIHVSWTLPKLLGAKSRTEDVVRPVSRGQVLPRVGLLREEPGDADVRRHRREPP